MTLKIPDSYQDYDFLGLSRREKSPLVRLRLLSYHHIQSGKSGKEVAEQLCVCRQTISHWVGRLRKGGLSQLRDAPRSGARPHLPKEKELAFKSRVIELQETREGGRIRAKEMQAVLLSEFKASYTESGVYELCKRIGLSWVTGRSQHPDASEQEQEEFKKTLLKN
jgi:transposase